MGNMFTVRYAGFLFSFFSFGGGKWVVGQPWLWKFIKIYAWRKFFVIRFSLLTFALWVNDLSFISRLANLSLYGEVYRYNKHNKVPIFYVVHKYLIWENYWSIKSMVIKIFIF